MAEVQKKCSDLTTPSKIFDSDLPALSSINREYGKDFTQAYIEGWIVNLCEFLNIGKNMRPAQIYETAGMIVEDYYYLKLADINLVFRNAKKGKYGQLYDRIDGQVILSWFAAYDIERTFDAEDCAISDANRLNGVDERQTGDSVRVCDVIKRVKR